MAAAATPFPTGTPPICVETPPSCARISSAACSSRRCLSMRNTSDMEPFPWSWAMSPSGSSFFWVMSFYLRGAFVEFDNGIDRRLHDVLVDLFHLGGVTEIHGCVAVIHRVPDDAVGGLRDQRETGWSEDVLRPPRHPHPERERLAHLVLVQGIERDDAAGRPA